jgi:two-component system phosphate regulon response regulator PhoB
MARIVILAQPSELIAFVEHALTQEGYFVRCVHDPALWASKINGLLPDLIILDSASSPWPTQELWVRIRNRPTAEPRLILIFGSATAVGGISAIEGDAFLARPLQPRALMASVRTLLGSKVVDESKSKIVVADLEIDPESYQVIQSGRPLSLTSTEFRLLYYLASHPNTVCRRDQLLRVISGNPYVVLREVDAYMRRMRKKIEQDPKKPRLIHSVRGQGYRFHIQAEISSTSPAQDGHSAPHSI